jgi:hypothetical protein
MDAELKAYLDGMVETITSHFDVRMDRLEQRMDRLEQRQGQAASIRWMRERNSWRSGRVRSSITC